MKERDYADKEIEEIKNLKLKLQKIDKYIDRREDVPMEVKVNVKQIIKGKFVID